MPGSFDGLQIHILYTEGTQVFSNTIARLKPLVGLLFIGVSSSLFLSPSNPSLVQLKSMSAPHSPFSFPVGVGYHDLRRLSAFSILPMDMHL